MNKKLIYGIIFLISIFISNVNACNINFSQSDIDSNGYIAYKVNPYDEVCFTSDINLSSGQYIRIYDDKPDKDYNSGCVNITINGLNHTIRYNISSSAYRVFEVECHNDTYSNNIYTIKNIDFKQIDFPKINNDCTEVPISIEILGSDYCYNNNNQYVNGENKLILNNVNISGNIKSQYIMKIEAKNYNFLNSKIDEGVRKNINNIVNSLNYENLFYIIGDNNDNLFGYSEICADNDLNLRCDNPFNNTIQLNNQITYFSDNYTYSIYHINPTININPFIDYDLNLAIINPIQETFNFRISDNYFKKINVSIYLNDNLIYSNSSFLNNSVWSYNFNTAQTGLYSFRVEATTPKQDNSGNKTTIMEFNVINFISNPQFQNIEDLFISTGKGMGNMIDKTTIPVGMILYIFVLIYGIGMIFKEMASKSKI